MRQTISGLVAAVAVMTASAVPAMACGGGLFGSSCSPCGQTYASPCAQAYVPAPVYTGCNTGCGGDADTNTPTSGNFPRCCARAANGHAAAPPRRVMNLRRLNRLKDIRPP